MVDKRKGKQPHNGQDVEIKAIPINLHGISPDVLDWSRWYRNPVILWEHQWHELPLAMGVLNLQDMTVLPHFHEMLPMAATVMELMLAGLRPKAHPGGYAKRDAAGNVTRFEIYELSLFFNQFEL
jgi:hypothetical protein